jgi:large subunit ribosomal protein L9|tara:strand:- start:311 stop:772 length:462 start_codon:yes stop_codon:yes gene_type:complete
MDVILLEKIGGLGELGDKVSVRSGYGRNFLLPTGKAVIANAENLEKVESRRIELEKGQKEVLEAAQGKAEALAPIELNISARVGEENKLYGSVGTQEIAEAIVKAGVAVEKKEILLPNGALREAGTHEVDVRLHPDITVKINLTISPEDSSSA